MTDRHVTCHPEGAQPARHLAALLVRSPRDASHSRRFGGDWQSSPPAAIWLCVALWWVNAAGARPIGARTNAMIASDGIPAVKLIPCDFRCSQGQLRKLSLKCVVTDDGRCVAELRGVLLVALNARQRLDLHKLVKRDLQPWLDLLGLCDFETAEHFFPSQRCLQARGVGEDIWSRREHVISILALIYLLAWMSAARRKKEEQQASRAILSACLNELLGADEAAAQLGDFRSIGPAECGLCIVGAMEGVCCHVRDGLLEADAGEDAPQSKLVRLICNVVGFLFRCPALRAWTAACFSGLAQALETEISEGFFGRDLLDEDFAMGRKRRLRLDEDAVAQIHKSVANGRASSCAAVVRVNKKLCTKTADNLPQRFLGEYRAAGWLTFGHGDLSLVMDGSRIGNPAQETEVMCIWGPAQDRAMALPCQVGKTGYWA